MAVPMAIYGVSVGLTAGLTYLYDEYIKPFLKLVGYWALLGFVIICMTMILLNPVAGSIVVVVFVIIAAFAYMTVEKAVVDLLGQAYAAQDGANKKGASHKKKAA